jgi:hypothetical protein
MHSSQSENNALSFPPSDCPRKQIFWVVAPCGWVISPRRFDKGHSFHPQAWYVSNETLGSNYPTRYNSPEKRLLQFKKKKKKKQVSQLTQSFSPVSFRVGKRQVFREHITLPCLSVSHKTGIPGNTPHP